MPGSPVPRRRTEIAPFDPCTVALVRESCRRLPGSAAVLADEFYRCLFEMAPQLRSMFAADLRPQQELLLRALLAAVEALDDPASLEPWLRDLGGWHRRALGVTDDMYVYVGHALVRAVRCVLGPGETAIGSAWVSVYEWIAATMIEGAQEADRGPDPLPAGGAGRSPRHGRGSFA